MHSLKDLPTRSPDGLTLAAVPARVDPADCLFVHPDAYDPSAAGAMPVPHGSRIGSSSARRQQWIKDLRPDLEVAPLRGNVPTRLGRVVARDYDAIVLAEAGIGRLLPRLPEIQEALERVHRVRLDPRQFVPAPAQGALGLQCRTDDPATYEQLKALEDPAARAAVDAERALLARAEGGCDAAFGSVCLQDPQRDGFELLAMIHSEGGIRVASAFGARPKDLIETVWNRLELDPA